LLCVAGAAVLALNGCGGGGGDPGTTFQSGDGPDGVSDVSSAKATQRSVSFSAETYNLDWGFDGATSSVTMRVADTAGNPVPAGTKIQFSVSGGVIDKTCTVGSGDAGASGCSVVFSTQNARPTTGLVSVVAWLVGEESYQDLNGNGKYDAGEPFYESGRLYRDDNNSKSYDSGDALVVDNALAEGKIGVGTSACRTDSAAAPTEIPLSIPNTCDGVWGKTLVRAQAFFAVSVPERLRVSNVLDGVTPQSKTVSVYTLADDDESRVAPLAGTTLTAVGLPSGCTAQFSPATVPSTRVRASIHTFTLNGTTCPTTGNVLIRATSGAFNAEANIPV
jgi:hypothetical protein